MEKQREMAKKKDTLLFLIFISDSGTKRPLYFQSLQNHKGAGRGRCGGCVASPTAVGQTQASPAVPLLSLCCRLLICPRAVCFSGVADWQGLPDQPSGRKLWAAQRAVPVSGWVASGLRSPVSRFPFLEHSGLSSPPC